MGSPSNVWNVPFRTKSDYGDSFTFTLDDEESLTLAIGNHIEYKPRRKTFDEIIKNVSWLRRWEK